MAYLRADILYVAARQTTVQLALISEPCRPLCCRKSEQQYSWHWYLNRADLSVAGRASDSTAGTDVCRPTFFLLQEEQMTVQLALMSDGRRFFCYRKSERQYSWPWCLTGGDHSAWCSTRRGPCGGQCWTTSLSSSASLTVTGTRWSATSTPTQQRPSRSWTGSRETPVSSASRTKYLSLVFMCFVYYWTFPSSFDFIFRVLSDSSIVLGLEGVLKKCILTCYFECQFVPRRPSTVTNGSPPTICIKPTG